MRTLGRVLLGFALGFGLPSLSSGQSAQPASQTAHAADQTTAQCEERENESRITNTYIPLQLEGFPRRPKPLIELGSPFLGTGNIRRGFTIPTGAVWLPSFLAFGTLRTGVS